MFDIISVGASTVDIFVKSDQFSVANNLLSIGYSSKNETSDSLVTSGGGASNTAVAFSRLGLKSSCLSLVGSDPLSQYPINDLQDNNVDSNLLVHSPNDTTDFSVILVAPDGGRSIITNRGKTRLEVNDLDWDNLIHTQWFYITSLEGNLELLEQLVGYAVEHHISLSLNPGNRELSNLARLTPLLPHLDFLLLNTTESQVLTGIEVNQAGFWEKLKSFGAKLTAVTDGRNGAYVLDGQNKYFSPIINTQPVDETGAGDSFGSGFVAGLIHHLTPQEALFWGIKNSASVVSKMGAKGGLLTFTEIKG